jgi:hypothetical protein
VLSEMVLQTHQLDVAKPGVTENDFAFVERTEDGLIIHNTRYKTRARPGEEVCYCTSSSVHTVTHRFA